jgi:glutamate-5-semialdehyde dehydrogenase
MREATRSSDDALTALMADIGHRAKGSARMLATLPTVVKNAALRAAAAEIRAAKAEILARNAEDVAEAEAKGVKGSFLDRLKLDEARLEAVAQGVEAVAALPDPVGRVLAEWTTPNALRFERVATPLGVIGVIFESRPNVAADAGALCLKSGNAAILRGGSESFRTASRLVEAMRAGLCQAGAPQEAIQLAPTREREAVGLMLSGLDGAINVIVPRGGKSLVARVESEARVPVFAHLEGICHVYVHAGADLAMAERIVLNAKLRRTGVCGSAETLLIDKAAVNTHLAPLIAALLAKGCAIRGDATVQRVDPRVTPATEEDWRTEYLDAILAVRVVDGLDAAIDHIETYGSHHTESIITEDHAAADAFLKRVDSAIVLHNASTQFADGGEFGFGAEIGIATGKMHARGPVGLEQLCSFKYRVHGTGHIRP